MAVNTYEIRAVSSGKIQTLLTFADGCTMTEIHKVGLTEHDVLMKFDQKYYKSYPGDWSITFPKDHRVFRDTNIGKAFMMAIEYIWDRDHPEDHDYFY